VYSSGVIVTELSAAALAIGTWLMNLREKKLKRDDDAVKTVLLALNETEAYIAESKETKRDRARERRLVTFWTDAAVAIRRNDPDLAGRLEAKAQYWTDPENWTPADVKRAGIQIKVVAADAKALLAGK
jgi:hypothetical protein